MKLKYVGNIFCNTFSKCFVFSKYSKYISLHFRLSYLSLNCRIRASQHVFSWKEGLGGRRKGGGGGVFLLYWTTFTVQTELKATKDLQVICYGGLLSAVIESLKNWYHLLNLNIGPWLWNWYARFSMCSISYGVCNIDCSFTKT